LLEKPKDRLTETVINIFTKNINISTLYDATNKDKKLKRKDKQFIIICSPDCCNWNINVSQTHSLRA